LAYDLAPDGTAKFRKVLVDYAPQDGPDGLVVDVDGNLYVAVRDTTRPGITVYSPEGKELATVLGWWLVPNPRDRAARPHAEVLAADVGPRLAADRLSSEEAPPSSSRGSAPSVQPPVQTAGQHTSCGGDLARE